MEAVSPLRVFIGYDHRQPISLNVLQQSIYSRSSKPVSITPLVLSQLPLKRQGLTPFTFSRFLTPYLCGFKGWALFLDLDMLVVDDIAKLFDCADDKYTVMVAKNKKRFEWASVMLFNCGKCQKLVPRYIEEADGLHTIGWAEENKIGDLPSHWNHLVGYDNPRNDASLIHYTQGVPCFDETKDSEHADKWFDEHKLMNSAGTWKDLMGRSVHAAKVKGHLMPKYKAEKILHEQALAAG
tara:strand:+ start:24274 stop:24990 length:717 start_codon:yes stop_codon:yes gene_type:complete